MLSLFKTFVATNRPKLDIDKVATGETWFGPDALENDLVDGLVTVDELLMTRVADGAEVFSLAYKQAKSPLAALSGAGASAAAAASVAGGGGGWRSLALALLTRTLAPGGAIAAASGSLLSEQSLLDGLGPAEASQQATARVEREVLASRLSGEAEPMVRWNGSPMGGEPDGAGDSWHL